MTSTNFTSFGQSTQEDWKIIIDHTKSYFSQLPDRIMQHLQLLEADSGGFPVSRLEHCLQTATLASENGEDEEYITCALLHDMGDTLGTLNHADIAAAILEPFVSEENHWMVKHHGIFQGYYFFHHLGMDRNVRDKFSNSPHFERTKRFCELYDNPAFDLNRSSMPLDEFEPLLRRVFSAPKRGIFQKVVDEELSV